MKDPRSDPVADLLAEYLDGRTSGKGADPEGLLARCPEDRREELRKAISFFEKTAEGGSARLSGLPPARFGDFEILREIGRGGMGVVYEARQVSLDRRVALKLIPPWQVPNDRVLGRLQREAQAIARLHHPHIVSVHATGEEQGIRYVAMELVGGQSVDEVLREAARRGQRVPIPRILRWIADIARALQQAHEAGLIHRDIKPSNIRIDPEGRALLLDFGLAHDLRSATLTRTGEFQGSPYYCSPEQVAARRIGIDARTDVYSLGVTLYEAVTGKLPFEGDTTEQVFNQILVKEPVHPRRINPSISGDLETVILTAMEKDRERRYPTAAAFAEDLEALLEVRPIRARPAGVFLRLRRWSQRNPPLAAALVGVFLLLAGGLVVTTSLWREVQSSLQRSEEAQGKAKAAQEEAEKMAALAGKTAEKYKAVNTFLRDMLGVPDPDFDGREVKVVDILEKTSAKLEDAYREDPDTAAAVHHEIGSTFSGLGFYEKGIPHLRRAIQIFEEQGKRDSEDYLSCLKSLGGSLAGQGANEEAAEIFRQFLDCAPAYYAPLHPAVLDTQSGLGNTLIHLGLHEEAEKLLISTLEAREKTGAAAEIRIGIANSLIGLYTYQGRYEEAEALAEASYKEFRGLLSGYETQFQTLLVNLAVLIRERKKDLERSEALLWEAHQLRVQKLGRTHNWTLIAAFNLAINLVA